MKNSKPASNKSGKASIKSGKNGNQQAFTGKSSITSKHSISGYKKPASIGKHATIIGRLGGRPRES